MKKGHFYTQIHSFINDYLILERGYSINTVQSYSQTFVLLLTYCQEIKKIKLNKISIETFDRAFILDFLNWLSTSRKCSDATRNVRLAAIQSFFKYLSTSKNFMLLSQCQSIKSIRFKKFQSKSTNYLTSDALKFLLTMPNLNTKKGRRDLALLSLLYDLGARVQEVITLTPAALNLKPPMTAILKGKGNKVRVSDLFKGQVVHLRIYMKENRLNESHNQDHPLFFNSRGEQLTRAGVNYILNCYFKKAVEQNPSIYPKKISTHSLRHSKAIHLRKAGSELIYIRDVLGHASVTTTEKYARIESKERREALEGAYLNLAPKSSKSKWEGNSKLLEWLKSF